MRAIKIALLVRATIDLICNKDFSGSSFRQVLGAKYYMDVCLLPIKRYGGDEEKHSIEDHE